MCVEFDLQPVRGHRLHAHEGVLPDVNGFDVHDVHAELGHDLVDLFVCTLRQGLQKELPEVAHTFHGPFARI